MNVRKRVGGRGMPRGRLGANAAWIGLAVMTHNVLPALKRLALEKRLAMRPKQMRFQQKRVQAVCRAWHPPAGHASYAASLTVE
jgi:hypothetical protein